MVLYIISCSNICWSNIELSASAHEVLPFLFSYCYNTDTQLHVQPHQPHMVTDVDFLDGFLDDGESLDDYATMSSELTSIYLRIQSLELTMEEMFILSGIILMNGGNLRISKYTCF